VFYRGGLTRATQQAARRAAITYATGTGDVDVITDERRQRAPLARIFAQHLLGLGTATSNLPRRRLDLNRLLGPVPLRVETKDGIEAVLFRALHFTAVENPGQRIVVTCDDATPDAVHDLVRDRLGAEELTRAGWALSRADLLVRFAPCEGGTRYRLLPMTLNVPNRCDLNDKTENEWVMGCDYLKRWNVRRAQ